MTTIQTKSGRLVAITSPRQLISEKKPVNINPTFLLRGIDPVDILQKYINGEYEKLDIPKEKALKVDTVITADRTIGENSESEIYEYTDVTNNRHRVITTDHARYAIARDGHQLDQIKKPSICRYCRRTFEHEPVGIPVKMEYFRDIKFTIFHIEAIICTFECARTLVKWRTQFPPSRRDPLYRDSETLLLNMFDIIYPSEKLGEIGDWWLLECNNGPIKEKDFFSKTHIYRRTTNLVMLPSKVEYEIEATK